MFNEDEEEEYDDEKGVVCGGCGEDDAKNYVFDCDRCGREICPTCSDDQRHCTDCYMSIFSGEDEW